MIARAASAALAIVAGSLVTPLAAAEPPPPLAAPPQAESASPITPAPPIDASPVVAPPVYSPPGYVPPGYAPPGYAPPGYAPPGYAPPGYAPPGYAPPGYAPPGYGPLVLYAPWPMVWRDGAWHAAGSSHEDPPRPPLRDPMLTTGIVLGVTGIVTTAIGAAWFIAASSDQSACGLSGCITLPHWQSRSSAAATIAGGVSATLFGSVLAYGGTRGPTPARRSNGRMVTGLVFTALGLGAASGSVMQAVMLKGPEPSPDQAFPTGFSSEASRDDSSPAALALLAGVCFAVGIPLWITGARLRPRPEGARFAASSLDLLPSAGGAVLRWTR